MTEHTTISCPLEMKTCVPCRGGVEPLHGDALAELAGRTPNWDVVEQHHLSRTFKFPNFAKALEFVNRVGVIAEQEKHHPDIYLSWGKVMIEIHTHKINGLTESDFILAAKISRLE